MSLADVDQEMDPDKKHMITYRNKMQATRYFQVTCFLKKCSMASSRWVWQLAKVGSEKKNMYVRRCLGYENRNGLRDKVQIQS